MKQSAEMVKMVSYIIIYNTKYNLQEIEQLRPEGFAHKTVDMWRGFCRHVHVVDIENNYFEDGLIEDQVEEMIITVGG